jgi:hypothetical protein
MNSSGVLQVQQHLPSRPVACTCSQMRALVMYLLLVRLMHDLPLVTARTKHVVCAPHLPCSHALFVIAAGVTLQNGGEMCLPAATAAAEAGISVQQAAAGRPGSGSIA